MPKPSPAQITRIAKLLRVAMDKGASEPEAISALRRLRSYLDSEGLAYGDIFTEPSRKRPVRQPQPQPKTNWAHVYVHMGPFNNSTTAGGFRTSGA